MRNRHDNQPEGYRIKDILAYKEEGGKEYFLIWWQDYPKREATWQPISHVSHIHDFQDYYEKLRESYLQQKQPYHERSRESLQMFESFQEEALDEDSEELYSNTKAKRIRKIKRKGRRKVGDPASLPKLQSEQMSEQQQKELSQRNQRVNLDSQENDQKQQKNDLEFMDRAPAQPQQRGIKRLLKRAAPVKFDIKIKQFKQLPFLGQKLKGIKEAFKRGGKMVYQIQLNDRALPEPIILHENYIKILWPRQFAEYLLSKVKP